MTNPELPDYLWPDPNQPGMWIDAWNGAYFNLEQALEDAAGGVGRPWILQRGESIVDEAEVERRLALQKREAQHQRDERMLQELSASLYKYRQEHGTDLEIKAVSRTIQNSIREMTASWDRTMRAIERAAQAVEHAANRWEEKASDL